MAKTRLPTVTLAVSAFNEEQNIKLFLKSVLAQKSEGYQLKHIWVFNDGSSDRTAKQVKAFRSKKISLFDGKQRIGKSSRLNEAYKLLKTDILIQSDADVIMAHPCVVRDIIQPLIANENVGMCGGNPLPYPGKTFTEKAVNCTVNAYLPLRQTLRGGNNVFSCDGRLLAYKRDLVKKIYIPHDMTSNDRYTYYCCLALGYAFRSVDSAKVYFRSPTNLKDHIRQNGRFVSCPFRMVRYFHPELIKKEEHIPPGLSALLFVKQYIRHPILCTYIFLTNVYCKYNAQVYEKKITSLWPMAASTKGLI